MSANTIAIKTLQGRLPDLREELKGVEKLLSKLHDEKFRAAENKKRIEGLIEELTASIYLLETC